MLAQNPAFRAVTIVMGLLTMVVVVLIVAALYRYVRYWMKSYLSGAPISIFDLLWLTFQKIPPGAIVDARIMAEQNGLNDDAITTQTLGAHYRAGGDVRTVISEMIQAQRYGQPLQFEKACQLELSGKLANRA